MKKIAFLIGMAVLSCLAAMAQQRHLMLVHTSDTHSCIEPISKNFSDTAQADKGGFMRRAALLRQLRKQNPELLLLDCGDFSQGSAYYNLYHGEVEVKLMNEMGYDAATLGNHEFDFGLDNLARLIRMAKFPFVCANYKVEGTPLAVPEWSHENHGTQFYRLILRVRRLSGTPDILPILLSEAMTD